MGITGYIYAEKINFLYNVIKNDFIYICNTRFCVDEFGNLYLPQDVDIYYSIKEIKNIPEAFIPVSVVGSDLTSESFILHFNMATMPSIVETVSKFEAEEIREDDHVIIFSSLDVRYVNYESNSLFKKTNIDESRKIRKLKKRKYYESLIVKELESKALKLASLDKHTEAIKIAKIIRKRKKLLDNLEKRLSLFKI